MKRFGRWIQSIIDKIRGKESKPKPIPAPTPAPPLNPPQDAIGLFQWIPGDQTTLCRLRADYAPRGLGIATAQGHVHIVPDDQSHDAWMAAATRRPPVRVINGWAEYDLPGTSTLIARAARHKRAPIIMAFFKLGKHAPETGTMDISFFCRIGVEYGTATGEPVVRNRDNKNWGEA